MDNDFVLVKNFIEDYVNEDLKAGLVPDNVVKTRMPPEPNGYLHLGHLKSACINFGIAAKFGGKCFLYFDDTNPGKESDEYVQAIKNDLHWLGFDWDKEYFASDHYDDLFDIAVQLIKDGKAFVCDLTAEEMREYRGTLTEPGKDSPYRNRSVEENLDLFMRMKNGEFPDGTRTLRVKIDMASPIMCMRDPVIYRIMHKTHHRTGDKWCIYPMYDYASPILDAIAGVTHSLCGPEFEERRPLYNWSVASSGRFPHPPRQIEFARLNIKNVILGKRFLKKLVEDGVVSGWDDPRMATIAGMRRRGYPREALREFINNTGISKAYSECEYDYLEHFVRDYLKTHTETKMAVADPVKLVIDNYEGEETVQIESTVGENPEKRDVVFGRELYIDASDFMIEPPKKYFRMYVGNEVRLKGAYIVKCTGYEETDGGLVVHCEYDPDTRSGGTSTKKVKGTIQWVNQKYAMPCEFRMYDMLIDPEKNSELDASERLNENSLVTKPGYIEPSLADAQTGDKFQFIRVGYFVKDRDSTESLPVFNRIVSLKDSYKPKK